MTKKQEKAVDLAIAQCDDEDQSTEYMLQFAADRAGVDVEDVIEYLVEKGDL